MAEVLVNRRKRYADVGSIIATLRWRRRIAADGVIIVVANGNALATYDVDEISYPIAYHISSACTQIRVVVVDRDRDR